ncbi:MAG: Mth938-like domain-containing protein [Syntrophobacteraceae bacterium]
MAEIGHYNFGEIEVDGKRYTGDIKIIEGTVISDWWRAQGHKLASSDIEDILSGSPEILVVGKGLPGRMKVSDELRERLALIGTSLVDEPTPKAVETFNSLKKSGKKVAGVFHLTC